MSIAVLNICEQYFCVFTVYGVCVCLFNFTLSYSDQKVLPSVTYTDLVFSKTSDLMFLSFTKRHLSVMNIYILFFIIIRHTGSVKGFYKIH